MSNDTNLNETALAIRDQFEIEKELNLPVDNERERYEALKQMLVARLSQMIDREFDKFVNTLYRIDVNESKVKKILAEETFDKAIEMIADLIIQRQMEKVITRKKYSKPEEDLNFDI